MIKVSATRISSFLRCKQKYYFQYVKKLPKIAKMPFKMGIACHEPLELAGEIWMQSGDLTSTDKARILQLYDTVSVREGIDDPELHAEGKMLVSSRINNFSLGRRIISLEEKFGFEGSNYPDLRTNTGVPVMGAMDKVIELEDGESLLIVDYKTSKTAPSVEQLRADIQLSLYDLVASILWPQYKRIILCLDMLKSEPLFSYRTINQRAEFDTYLATVYEAMMAFTEEHAKPELNIFCPWCDFKDYCKEYEKASTQSEFDFLPLASLTNEELIQEHEHIKNTSKILEARKRDISMIIMEKIKDTGKDLQGDTNRMCITQSARTVYDPRSVAGIVPIEDLVGMISLNKSAIDEYCSRNPRIKTQLDKMATTNYNAPFLSVKKLKK